MTAIMELSWKAFDAKRQQTDLAIFPLGAVEVYGPHLPLGSDSIVAERVARLVAERTGGIMMPRIPVGYSKSLADFPGTLNVSPAALRAYLADVCDSVYGWGLRRFLFVNTHLGNVPVVSEIAEGLRRDRGARCAQIDWWRFIQPLSTGIVEGGAAAHGHASETGTSVLLYLAPQFVTSGAVHSPSKVADPYPEVIQYRSYAEKTDTGTLGNATLGTKEKGEQIVRRAIDRIVDFVEKAL